MFSIACYENVCFATDCAALTKQLQNVHIIFRRHRYMIADYMYTTELICLKYTASLTATAGAASIASVCHKPVDKRVDLIAEFHDNDHCFNDHDDFLLVRQIMPLQ